MSQGASQKSSGKDCKRLIGHSSDSNDTMQVCQQSAEKAEANYLRAHRHWRANKIGGKTYCKGTYNRLRGIAVNSKKHQKD